MTLKRRDLSFPKLRAQAPIAPETLDTEARTVEVRFYSGASVQRFPFFDDPYELSFSLDKKAVRLERFNAGAPLVDNHRDDLPLKEAVLGVVEEAWLADDGGHARVKIAADRPDILARIQDGILRNFSMGAVIHQMRDITEKGDPQKRLLAIDWEPHELSIVAVPADPGAQALAQAERFPCQLLSTDASGASPEERNQVMKIKVRLLAAQNIEMGATKVTLLADQIIEIEEADFDEKLHSKDLERPEPADSKVRADQLQIAETIEADRKRAKQIKEIQTHYMLDDVWAMRHIKQNTEMSQVLRDATERRAKDQTPIDGMLSMGAEFESIPYRTERLAEALFSRMYRKEPPEAAKRYARFSIAEAGFEILALNGRTKGTNLDPLRNPGGVIKEALALHTTSDFPKLLENVLNKMLLAEFEMAPATYERIARRIEFKDFRAHPQLRAGDFPNLLQVNEHGEFKSGTVSESKESVTAVTYGRVLGLSRQLLVNDDLNALQDWGTKISQRVRDFKNATFFTNVITTGSGLGPTLSSDSVVLYNSAHTNTGSSGALTNTLLGESLSKMMSQTSLDGLKLNIEPSILLVPPGSLVLARTLLTAIQATQASNINPFAGTMTAIGDANLSGTRFYVLADPGRGANYVYGSLGGQDAPDTEVRAGFEVDGIQVKVRTDFGCGAVDFRFGYTAAGA